MTLSSRSRNVPTAPAGDLVRGPTPGQLGSLDVADGRAGPSVPPGTQIQILGDSPSEIVRAVNLAARIAAFDLRTLGEMVGALTPLLEQDSSLLDQVDEAALGAVMRLARQNIYARVEQAATNAELEEVEAWLDGLLRETDRLTQNT